jgi:hypothetical protein
VGSTRSGIGASSTECRMGSLRSFCTGTENMGPSRGGCKPQLSAVGAPPRVSRAGPTRGIAPPERSEIHWDILEMDGLLAGQKGALCSPRDRTPPGRHPQGVERTGARPAPILRPPVNIVVSVNPEIPARRGIVAGRR